MQCSAPVVGDASLSAARMIRLLPLSSSGAERCCGLCVSCLSMQMHCNVTGCGRVDLASSTADTLPDMRSGRSAGRHYTACHPQRGRKDASHLAAARPQASELLQRLGSYVDEARAAAADSDDGSGEEDWQEDDAQELSQRADHRVVVQAAPPFAQMLAVQAEDDDSGASSEVGPAGLLWGPGAIAVGPGARKPCTLVTERERHAWLGAWRRA